VEGEISPLRLERLPSVVEKTRFLSSTFAGASADKRVEKTTVAVEMATG